MLDLNALNSATKYPSIPTYHALGERGSLLEEPVVFDGDVVLTEKIDGTNSRIILMPGGDWFLGSREELLTARGDRVHNPALGIVDALRDLADRIKVEDENLITVFYLETYGGRIGGQARQYTGDGTVGFRMFDLASIPMEVVGWDRARISAWRDAGGQSFANEDALQRAAEAGKIDLAPRLARIPARDIPVTLADTRAWLSETLPGSLVGLDAGALGRPEGIVLRTTDRAVIAKARFQDYERTHKRKGASSTGRAPAAR
jgi:hypothetical protein